MSCPIHVVLCDDSPSTGVLVEHWLEAAGGFVFAGCAHGMAELAGLLERERCDVVLLDTMRAPGDRSYIDLVRRAAPDAAVVLYSGYVPLLSRDALPPADAFVSKDVGVDELVAAVRAASTAKRARYDTA